jgi:hypothetical protein
MEHYKEALTKAGYSADIGRNHGRIYIKEKASWPRY